MTTALSLPLPQEREDEVIQQLTALAQASRLNIFRELVKVYDTSNAEHGLAAGELAARMQMAPPTLSFHLKELARANLVSSERQGRSVIYRANLESIRGLIAFLLEDCCSNCC
jgi:DNA-binding transcriptional ArsR family regulator